MLYTNKVRFKLKFTKLIRSKNDNNKTKTNNMGNMSYCRFRNTLYDLQDCANAIEMGEFTDEGIDSSELSALMEIRDLCEYFVENLSEEINEIYETFYNNK